MRRRRLQVLVSCLLVIGIVACGDSNGPGSPVPLTLSLSSNKLEVDPGESFELNWTSQNARACEVSGGWQGPRPTAGIEHVSSITSGTVYEMKCWNRQATVTANVAVQVRFPAVRWDMRVTAEHEGRSLTLFWPDYVSDATAFFVDSSIPGGIWEQVAQLPGHVSYQHVHQWQGASDGKRRFRIRMQTPDGQYLLLGESSSTYVTIDPDRAVEFILESQEPIGIGSYLVLKPVGWVADSAELDIDSTFFWRVGGPGLRSYLDTGKLSSGSHLLTAKVRDQSYAVQTIVHHPVTIDKSGINATMEVLGYAQSRSLHVAPYTDVPVTRVTFFVNGIEQGFLEQANSPIASLPPGCCGSWMGYEWTWDVSGLPSGSYAVRALVQTEDGLTQAGEEVIYELRQSPELAVLRPTEYELVGDTLTVSGKVKDDVGGVYVKVTYHSLYWTSGGVCYWDFATEFNRTCDISNVPDGMIWVVFEVGNSAELIDTDQQIVLHSSSAASRYSRALEIENGWLAEAEDGTLLFADGGRVKLRNSDGEMLDITPAGESVVPEGIPAREPWRARYLRDMRLQMSARSVAIEGTAGTYVWRDGMTEQFPGARHPILKWPWLLIEYDGGLILRDLQLGSKTLVHTRGADMGYCGHDFAVDAEGDVNIYFCSGPRVPGTTEVPSGNILRYSTATDFLTFITTDNQYNWPRTDGKRVIFATTRDQLVHGSYPNALEGYWLGSGGDYPSRAEMGDGFVAWESRDKTEFGSRYRGIRVLSPDDRVFEASTDAKYGGWYDPQHLMDLDSGKALFLVHDLQGEALHSWELAAASQEVVPWEVKNALIDGPRTIFSLPSGGGEVVFLEK